MNYKKRYTEALSRARELSKTVTGAIYEYIFPELKESEDERMKRAIKHVLYENYTDAAVIEGVEIAEIIAWLGEQGQTFTKKDVDDAYLQGICDAKYEIEKQGKKLNADEVIEWLECKAFQGWAEEINIKQIVDKFKKDFGL